MSIDITPENLRKLCQQAKDVDATFGQMEMALDDAAIRIEELEKAMNNVLSSLANDQGMYDRNGPEWTTPQGNEYETTSSVLACSNERAEILRKALILKTTF